MQATLSDTLDALNLSESEYTFSHKWDASMASMPDGVPGFLTPEQFIKCRERATLPAEVDEALREAAAAVIADPNLLRFAWHCHELLYTHLDYDTELTGDWPDEIDALGELTPVLWLLIGLSAIPQMRAYHERRRVPEQITYATVTHYPASVEFYRMNNGGRRGMDPRVLYWLRNHTRGELYQLGRFEYMVRPFAGLIRAFRNSADGRVIALADEGTRFNPEGTIDAEGSAEGWTARLLAGDGSITGTPISPSGVALDTEVSLDLDTWHAVLAPGYPMLDTHIPPGGGMTLERCRDSMQQALEFFPKYFPERPFFGFGCISWILDPQIAQWYRPDSNMVLFQEQLYLFPWPSGERDGLYNIFGRSDVDPATQPAATSLERAVLDYLVGGGRMRTAGMFLLKEDFCHLGEKWYRKRFSL